MRGLFVDCLADRCAIAIAVGLNRHCSVVGMAKEQDYSLSSSAADRYISAPQQFRFSRTENFPSDSFFGESRWPWSIRASALPHTKGAPYGVS